MNAIGDILGGGTYSVGALPQPSSCAIQPVGHSLGHVGHGALDPSHVHLPNHVPGSNITASHVEGQYVGTTVPNQHTNVTLGSQFVSTSTSVPVVPSVGVNQPTPPPNKVRGYTYYYAYISCVLL